MMEAVEHQRYMSNDKIERVYYIVNVEYEQDHAFNSNMTDFIMETDPIDTYTNALKIAKKVTESIKEKKGVGASIIEVDVNEVEDGYYYYVIDNEENLIAQVGITVVDYTNTTIH